jgi:hypothetical protein
LSGNAIKETGGFPRFQYSDYLTIFLFLEFCITKDAVYKRMADVIQVNMANNPKLEESYSETGFKMQSALTHYEIDTTDVDFCVYLRFSDAILECAEINARNPITFDSCMTIVEPYRDELHTRALTLRRFLDPREPENPQYIFGTGNVMVDVITGEVSSTKDNEAIKPIVFESNKELVLNID